MWRGEDSYGRIKRLDFIRQSVLAISPMHVLDIGCGNGTQLTAPLAHDFPNLQILGVDSDAASIQWANTNFVQANLRFISSDALSSDQRFSLIIASEVIEHVNYPDLFLSDLRCRLEDGGRLIITVPNGHGPSEMMSLLETVLSLIGVRQILSQLKHRILGKPVAPITDTLAVSPHVNFFTKRELCRVFDQVGLGVVRFRPRTVFCGWLIDSLIPVGGKLATFNARLGDWLPAVCASDWMFELVVTHAPRTDIPWHRGKWACLRKRLNEKRWNVIDSN